MKQAVLILPLLCVFVAGCEKAPAEKLKDQAEDAKDHVQEAGQNVFSGTVKAIDKAKDVGKTLMDSAEAERRKIDKESE